MSQIMEPAITAANAILRDEYRCLIGGELVAAESGKTFAKFNPATGEKLADVPDTNEGFLAKPL